MDEGEERRKETQTNGSERSTDGEADRTERGRERRGGNGARKVARRTQ